MIREFTAAAGISIFLCAGAVAQDAPAGDPTPTTAQLDALLAAKDWNGLSIALTPRNNPQAIRQTTPWLEARVDAGQGGTVLPQFFSRNLWFIGMSAAANIPPADVDTISSDSRITAGMMTLYEFDLILVDAPECADNTAPNHRYEEMLRAHTTTLRYLASRPPDVRQKAIDFAAGLERKTAPARIPDDYLCRGGLQEMLAEAKAGTGKEVHTPGMYGKTIQLGDLPGWQPAFNPPEVYHPKQEQQRVAARMMLAKLVGQ